MVEKRIEFVEISKEEIVPFFAGGCDGDHGVSDEALPAYKEGWTKEINKLLGISY